jgi:rRNA maturation endonuclease Nob1
MAGYGGYDEFDSRDDRDYEFDVTCTKCGTVRGSLHDGPCPSCGSSSHSASSADTARWNEHLRREGR